MPADSDLYGVLTDEDAFKSLRTQRESQFLSRYPSFHASPNLARSSMAVVDDSAASTTPFPKSAGGNHPVRIHDAEDAPEPGSLTPEVVAETTGASWYDQSASVWNPRVRKISNKLLRRNPPPPSRAQPAPPLVQSTPSSYHETPKLLASEPARPFAKVKGPKKASASKGPQPAPLPSTALLSPEGASQRRFALRRGSAGAGMPPMSPPPVTSTTGGTPYWMSPATSNGRLSSSGPSRRGSSAGTSSVAFTSTSFYSSTHPSSAVSRSTSAATPREDGEPVEDLAPRKTLFVVNADPDPSESEPSPLESKPIKPFLAPAPSRPNALRKKNAPAYVPPVPPLPPRFQAPPPPSHPPPVENSSERSHERSVSQPSVPASVLPKAGGLKRSSSDQNGSSSSDHRKSQPIPIPPAPSSKRPSHKSRSRSNSTSSSTSESESPFTPEASPPTSAEEASIPPEWIYPLQLTLEELFKGGKYNFRITTRLLNGEPQISEVEIDVKPGWKSGTRVIFPNAGNERKPGVFQTMIFVVEQIHHERFARLEGGKLVLNQDISLVDALKEGPRKKPVRILGLDGKILEFAPPSGVIKPGQETIIKNHGMYIRSKSKVVGRGDLVIRWNVCMPAQLTQDQIHKMRGIFN